MIPTIFLTVAVSTITLIFSFFPRVDVLPTIVGVDLDTILIGGISSLMRIADTFWYIGDVIQGFLFITGYLVAKALLKFIANALSKVAGASMS